MSVGNPEQIHAALAAAFNAHDVDALVDLYEDDAVLVAGNGSLSAGRPAIRQHWIDKVSLGGQMILTTRYVVQLGDLALLRTDWTFSYGNHETSASTAEIARRQQDGSWRYVIDHPYGGNPDLATATASIAEGSLRV